MGFGKNIKLLFENLFEKVIDITIIVIECVAVDSAGFNYISDGNFIERLVGKQFNKSIVDKFFCILLHIAPPFINQLLNI
jgi:hypothetical protein